MWVVPKIYDISTKYWTWKWNIVWIWKWSYYVKKESTIGEKLTENETLCEKQISWTTKSVEHLNFAKRFATWKKRLRLTKTFRDRLASFMTEMSFSEVNDNEETYIFRDVTEYSRAKQSSMAFDLTHHPLRTRVIRRWTDSKFGWNHFSSTKVWMSIRIGVVCFDCHLTWMSLKPWTCWIICGKLSWITTHYYQWDLDDNPQLYNIPAA